uniref:SUI1 domain-containing protein n=1 Tax=Paramoeba aestuarina TaxID=180227 RepID=A0A7S4P9H0_9EUKA
MTVVAMEVDWVYPRYLQYERPKPPCSCAYDSVTVVEDPFAYSRIAFGDYALIPRSLYSEPPPKAQNNNNNNNKNNNKKKGKGASKAKAEPPKSDSEEVSDDLLCAWVVMTETKVKLQWQDGSIQEGILSKDLISRTNALDNDFWPQDIAVMRQGAYREHTRVVVQNVDAAERTCTVKFIDGGPERKVFQNAKGDEDKKQEAEEGDGDEEISVYDLQPLEELSVEPGDLVLRLHPGPASAASSSSSKEDPLDWLGVVMRLKDGLVCVNWLDGSKGECPPDDLFHVENDSEAEGEDDYYSDEEYDSDSASEEYDSDDSEDGVPLNDPLVELLYDRYFGQDDDDEEDIDSDEFDNNLVAGLAMGMMNLASYFQGRDGTCHNIDDLEELEEIVSDDEEDEPKKTIGIREIEEIDEVEESEENNEESEKKDDKKSKTPSSSSSSSSSAKEVTNTAAPPLSASSYTTSASPDEKKSLVVELFGAPQSLQPLFLELGHEKRHLYTKKEVVDHLWAYASKHKLGNKGNCKLDELLAKALFKKGQEPPEELPKKDLADLFLSKMTNFHEVNRGGLSDIRKGPVKPVVITLEQRQGGRKHITRITGLESFAVPAKELADELRSQCAASTSVKKIEGKVGGEEVMVQGLAVRQAGDHLVKKYEVPRKYIQNVDKSKTKKKGK